jgi:hypothetical protein
LDEIKTGNLNLSIENEASTCRWFYISINLEQKRLNLFTILARKLILQNMEFKVRKIPVHRSTGAQMIIIQG